MTLEELEYLIAGCQTGNRLFQQRMYQQFYALGMSVSMRYAETKQEAEEICHDGFVKAFGSIHLLQEPAAIKTWLRRIFVHTAIDHYRKSKRLIVGSESLDAAESISLENNAIANISWGEKLRLIQALSPAYRLAFNLCIIEEYPVSEAAEILGIAEGTVRANIAKARFKLRKMLEFEQIEHER